MAESSKIFSHIIPEIENWPIFLLHQDRRNFVQEIDDYTLARLKHDHGDSIGDLIAKTVYLERIRIKEEPWKVDPPNDRLFWKRIQRQMLSGSLDKSKEESKVSNEDILGKIIHRYSEEIVGTFRIPTFLFARRFLTVFFNRLLNTAAGRNLKRIYGTRYRVYERLLTKGHLDIVRNLIKKGTVVIVPTHFSNLDSILIGYAMDRILGLPSFSYGAGLNLYNTGYTAYFMNRLGAYRVDRRKKNGIYLEALKGMSNLSMQRGTNSLFFPGGTRSRAGALETRLKMGLLGTAVEAQRSMFQQGKEEKVFIVPLVLGYHVVLEAKYLIDQHLRRTGKERYIQRKDEFHSLRKLIKFGWNFFSQPSEITLSFGRPMDVLGNFVDENGVSYDQFERPVEVKEYFMSEGEVNQNLQRESEYTKVLAKRIVERYHKENIVLTSHLVAFAAFNILRFENPTLDLYGLLRLPTDDYVFSQVMLKEVIVQLRDRLVEMEKVGDIKLSHQISKDIDSLLIDGISNLGVYHPQKPLTFSKNGKLISQDFPLLYYYHNRLENYGLDKAIKWSQISSREKELIEEI